MELRLSFVTSLLFSKLLRFCVSEGFGSNVLFYLGNGGGVSPLFGGHYSLVFLRFLPNCRLATFHSEVKNRRYHVFLKYKLTKLERGSQQIPHHKILFEAVFGKMFCTNARMLRGRKAFSFGSWVNLKVLTLDFEWFSSEVHCKLETKTVSNSPHFLSSPAEEEHSRNS